MTSLVERVVAAERIVVEQRHAHVGSEVVVRSDGPDSFADSVDGDDYRDLVAELRRLQRAVMGEPEPVSRTPS